MLKIDAICKQYKTKKVLKDIQFTLGSGEICGLLGKNGAGKSTLIKIILGLVLPDSGSVIFSSKDEMKRNIGYLSENVTLYSHLNSYDNLEIFSMMAGIKLTKKRANEILETVNLPKDKKVVDGFSMGMKRRLQLATVLLLKEYKFLILDEPTNGLDLEGMLWFKESMRQCKKRGQTILIASHAISEIQNELTDYMILDKGILLEKNKMDVFSKKQEIICIKLSDNDMLKMRNLCTDNHLDYIENHDGFQIFSEVPYTQLNKWIGQYEVNINSLSYEKANLENHFLDVIRESETC